MKVPLTVTTDPLPCSEVYNVYSGVSAPSECLPSFYQWRDLTRNPLYGEGKYRVKWQRRNYHLFSDAVRCGTEAHRIVYCKQSDDHPKNAIRRMPIRRWPVIFICLTVLMTFPNIRCRFY